MEKRTPIKNDEINTKQTVIMIRHISMTVIFITPLFIYHLVTVFPLSGEIPLSFIIFVQKKIPFSGYLFIKIL
jgi:hypothetical protein